MGQATVLLSSVCQRLSARRKAMPTWAAWWEDQRRAEDLTELQAIRDRHKERHAKLSCRIIDKPKVRRFLGWYCKSCGEPFTYYAKRAQSPYCAECNEAHHRRSANRRAKQNGARYEVNRATASVRTGQLAMSTLRLQDTRQVPRIGIANT